MNWSVSYEVFLFLRMLEDGRVDDCDKFKEEVEDTQRERRKQLAKKGQEHTPRFFK